jgi:hypothetical protein
MFSRVATLLTSAPTLRLSLRPSAAAMSSSSNSSSVANLSSERFLGGSKQFDDAVREHKGVLVFSKTTCPFCDRVKSAFDAKSIPYSVVELDRVESASAVRTELSRLSGIVNKRKKNSKKKKKKKKKKF